MPCDLCDKCGLQRLPDRAILSSTSSATPQLLDQMQDSAREV